MQFFMRNREFSLPEQRREVEKLLLEELEMFKNAGRREAPDWLRAKVRVYLADLLRTGNHDEVKVLVDLLRQHLERKRTLEQ